MDREKNGSRFEMEKRGREDAAGRPGGESYRGNDRTGRSFLGKFAVWYYMLSKRLLKRYSYIIVILSLPLSAFGLKLVSAQESGVLNIAVFAENPDDETAKAISESLINENGVIRFFRAGSEEEGRSLITAKKADALWILHENTGERIEKYARKGSAIFTLIESEESTALRLSREKLFETAYPYIAKAVYEEFMKQNLKAGAGESRESVNTSAGNKDKKTESAEAEDAESFEERIKSFYENIIIDEDIVRFAVLESGAYKNKDTEGSYLVSPFRGIAAVWLVLCGMAASMYFLEDMKSGLFALIPESERIWLAPAYHFGIILNSGIIMLISLVLSGSMRGPAREIPAMILFAAACAGFCNILRLICGNIYALSASVPVVIISLMVLSPVFVDAGIRPLQLMTPTYYYLNMIANSDFTYSFIIYIAVLFCLNTGLDRIIRAVRRERD